MARKVEWVSEISLKEHMEKHVISQPNESEMWDKIYENNKHVRADLIKNKDHKTLIDIYEKESKSVHEHPTKIYFYKDDSKCNNSYGANFVRESDNLLVAEHRDFNNIFKIHTCFFKERIFIDTEILSAIIALDKSITEDNIDKDIKIEDFSAYIYVGDELEKDLWKQITPIIYNDYKNFKKKDFFRKKQYIATEVLKSFLYQQIKYLKDPKVDAVKRDIIEQYQFVVDFLNEKSIKHTETEKFKKRCYSNLQSIRNVLNSIKSDVDMNMFSLVEMTVVFNLLCLYMCCHNNLREYDFYYRSVETEFNNFQSGTRNYETIMRLLIKNYSPR